MSEQVDAIQALLDYHRGEVSYWAMAAADFGADDGIREELAFHKAKVKELLNRLEYLAEVKP